MLYISELYFRGAEGFLGEGPTQSICFIEDMEYWNSLSIHKIVSSNNTTVSENVVDLTPSGGVIITNKNAHFTAYEIRERMNTSLFVTYNILLCEDEGMYECSLDSTFKRTARIKVKSKFRFK